MKKLGILTAAGLALPLIAQAALPPQYQRQREMKEIITSPAVEDALQSRPIDSISTTGDDVYTVTAGPCSVTVTIVDGGKRKPAGWAGPRQFDIEVGEGVCASE